MKLRVKLLELALLAAALPFTQAGATVLDPANDFLASYTGPKNADLDVLSADVLFDGGNFILSATMNGAIGTTANTLYVFGFDKGGATNAPFTAIGNPNVIFNAVVTVNGTTGAVAGGGGAGTSTINGNSFTAVLPASLLSSTGLPLTDYLWNLWPRVNAASGGGTQPIPDFAPNNAMQHVGVPEPVSLSMFGMGLLGLGWGARRRATMRA